MSTPTGPVNPGARADVWTHAWHSVGHRVAQLLAHPEPVTPDTLPLAVASHATTIRLLVTVHRDLTNRQSTRQGGVRPEAPTIQLLEANPIKALGHALARHPADPGVALSDVLTTRPAPGPAKFWHDLARAATVASQQWTNADPTSRPQHHQAWSLMADIGAISEGLAALDDNISRAATRMTAAVQAQLNTTPGVLSDQYASAAIAGLRAAGERTRHLAAAGPLPDVGPLRQPITRPDAVRFPAHVPAAQAAAIELLQRAETISPQDLALLARAQAKLSEHAARLSTDPDLTAAARGHAAVLADITTRRLRTIEPVSDPRPLQQTKALLDYVAKVPGSHPDAARIAAALARSQPDIVDALYRSARHHLAAGAWLVPNPNERATTAIWARQEPQAEDQPELVHRLVDARHSAHQLAAAGGPNPFPNTDAAIAVATARQGLPPRNVITAPSFPTATPRPAAPSRSPAINPGREDTLGR